MYLWEKMLGQVLGAAGRGEVGGFEGVTPPPQPAVPLPPPSHLVQGLDQGSDLFVALVAIDHAPADLEGHET